MNVDSKQCSEQLECPFVNCMFHSWQSHTDPTFKHVKSGNVERENAAKLVGSSPGSSGLEAQVVRMPMNKSSV